MYASILLRLPQILAEAAALGVGIYHEINDDESTSIPQSKPKDEQCDRDECPPCKTITGRIVPVNTIAYRPLDIIPDNEKQHGVYGSHHNIFIAKQAPKSSPQPCKCFWQKQKYVLKPHQLTLGMIPIEPFIY